MKLFNRLLLFSDVELALPERHCSPADITGNELRGSIRFLSWYLHFLGE